MILIFEYICVFYGLEVGDVFDYIDFVGGVGVIGVDVIDVRGIDIVVV